MSENKPDQDQDQPKIVAVFPGGESTFTPPAELSTYDIKMIHAGLLRPGPMQILSMSREILKWRGVPDPDLI